MAPGISMAALLLLMIILEHSHRAPTRFLWYVFSAHGGLLTQHPRMFFLILSGVLAQRNLSKRKEFQIYGPKFLTQLKKWEAELFT